MLESKIQKQIVKELESNGAYVVKVISATRKGVPDILACYKGLFIGLEVKRPEKVDNVSALQRYNLDAITKSGGKSYVVFSTDCVKNLINSLNLE